MMVSNWAAARPNRINGGASDGYNWVNYLGTAPYWVPDSDPSSTTNPLDPDTDADGWCDGFSSTGECSAGEDLNGNGQVDPGETDPNVSDIKPPGAAPGSTLLLLLP